MIETILTVLAWTAGILVFLVCLISVAADMNSPIPPERHIVVTILSIPFYLIALALYKVLFAASSLWLRTRNKHK